MRDDDEEFYRRIVASQGPVGWVTIHCDGAGQGTRQHKKPVWLATFEKRPATLGRFPRDRGDVDPWECISYWAPSRSCERGVDAEWHRRLPESRQRERDRADAAAREFARLPRSTAVEKQVKAWRPAVPSSPANPLEVVLLDRDDAVVTWPALLDRETVNGVTIDEDARYPLADMPRVVVVLRCPRCPRQPLVLRGEQFLEILERHKGSEHPLSLDDLRGAVPITNVQRRVL